MRNWNFQKKHLSEELHRFQIMIFFQVQIVLNKHDFHLKKWYCWTVTRSSIMLRESNNSILLFQSDHFLLVSGSSFKVLYLLIWKCYLDSEKAHKNSVSLWWIYNDHFSIHSVISVKNSFLGTETHPYIIKSA